MQYPMAVIRTQRENIKRMIKVMGFEVTLYIPRADPSSHELGPYNEFADTDIDSNTEYTFRSASAFIEWSPNTRRLKNLGYFTEGDLPVIAWITTDKPEEIVRRSVIKVPINYLPGSDKDDMFELVDQVVKNSYNATVVQCWHIVPKRRAG